MWQLLFAYLCCLRGCDAALDHVQKNPDNLGGGAGGVQQAPDLPGKAPPLATGSDGGLVKNACAASGCADLPSDPNSLPQQTLDPVGIPRNTETPDNETLATLTRALEFGETRPTPASTSDQCGPYTVKGNTYTNLCTTKDAGAICTEGSSEPICTCSTGWIGQYCNSDDPSATTTEPFVDPGRCKKYNNPQGILFRDRCGSKSYDNICNKDERMPFCTCTARWSGEYCDIAVTTTAADTSTTSPPTTTTIENLETCASYTTEDGVTYGNRCMTKDRGAQCQVTSSGPYCTCSVQRTGTFCTVDPEALGNLAGNSTGPIFDTVNIGKTNPATLVSALPALLSFLTDKQRVEMGLSIEEMVLDATFEEKPLNPRESFTFFNDPSLGNCFTFNHFNITDKYLARGPGPRYGLRVTLAFNIDEYAPWVEAVGVLTYIHPIGQNIYLESVKHTIQPGKTDQLSMKKNTFKRLRTLFAPPCVSKKSDSFYFPGDYSVDGCLRSCYQDSVYRTCGCMDASYARKPGVDSCAFDKLACVEEMNNHRGDPYYWPECKCGLPCGEEEYRYDTSRAMHLEGQVSNTMFSTSNSTSNTTQTSEITIFLNTLDVYAQVEELAFPFSRVLGLTGGFAGVLLGASVVFVVELILLFVRVGLIGCINRDTMKMRKQEGEMG